MEDPFDTIPLRRAQYRLAVMWFVPAFGIFELPHEFRLPT